MNLRRQVQMLPGDRGTYLRIDGLLHKFTSCRHAIAGDFGLSAISIEPSFIPKLILLNYNFIYSTLLKGKTAESVLFKLELNNFEVSEYIGGC